MSEAHLVSLYDFTEYDVFQNNMKYGNVTAIASYYIPTKLPSYWIPYLQNDVSIDFEVLRSLEYD
jgi:hypothetical protein